MIAKCLEKGGTIGICSPSHLPVPEEYEKIKAVLRNLGFRVKEAKYLYSRTDGYLAAAWERGADFNELILDDEVQLVFFGGGEGSVELLPFIDLNAVKTHPKRICSYSDATTILNTVTAQTGLETYYGMSPHTFLHLTDYNREQFFSHLVLDNAEALVHHSEWQAVTGGSASGKLIGGYSRNFAMWLGSPYCRYDKSRNYLLFIEDNVKFGGVDYVSAMLSNIEQMPFMAHVTGLLFGCYSVPTNAQLLYRLRRFGEEHRIPVVYCDDFGHEENQAILPIGRTAVLTEEGLIFDKRSD